MTGESRRRPANFGVCLWLLLALQGARAEEPPCPGSEPASAEASPPDTPEPTADEAKDSLRGPITIEADDDDFQFDVNGNARLCGNVEMRQGNRSIRTEKRNRCARTDRTGGRAASGAVRASVRRR